MIRLRCPGCGEVVSPHDAWRCPNADDPSVDHVLRWEQDEPVDERIDTSSENPFVRYRTRLHSYALAMSLGRTDADFVALVEHLDSGLGFRRTPFDFAPHLSCWVKDDTGNVAGSHKGRHLFGILLHLELLGVDAPLAIASCGNAALAAATIARVRGRRLQAFVPRWADETVVAELLRLDADVVRCERREGEDGDPCVLRFREAVAEGSVPFGCQGPDNALTIDGGRTIGWEITEQLGGTTLDAIFVQVGGGALASAVASSVDAPLWAVQTQGCAPLARAWARSRAIDSPARHRREVMWPWESEPHSSAHGILDDETYDWLAIVEAIERRGGGVVVAPERLVVAAARLANTDGRFSVDATGSAGLAGLLAAREQGLIGVDAPVAVLFTGARR